jgi:hypothetical protein
MSAPAAETPREIRGTLLVEEVGQFDSEWRVAMARSAESLDLAEVYAVLQRWRAIAAMTRADPQAHRQMLRRADRVLAGEQRGSITADQQRAMIARRLGRPEGAALCVGWTSGHLVEPHKLSSSCWSPSSGSRSCVWSGSTRSSTC